MVCEYLHLSFPDDSEKQALAARWMVPFPDGGRIDITFQCHMYIQLVNTHTVDHFVP